MVPAYRARRERSPLRRLWRLGWRALAVALLLVLGAVLLALVALRFLAPPVTGFMLEARFDAWRAGAEFTVAHEWAATGCLPDTARLAVIAAEDQKFASHHGFDVDQIANALAAARRGEGLRGASTISQQTARNLFLWSGQSWLRKGLEAGLTVLLEALWPKRRILDTYLNVAEFGPGVYGVEAAARRYFGKPAHRLDAADSALLAAVLPSPRRFDAAAPSAYVRQRQRRILAQLGGIERLPGVTDLLVGSGRCAGGD